MQWQVFRVKNNQFDSHKFSVVNARKEWSEVLRTIFAKERIQLFLKDITLVTLVSNSLLFLKNLSSRVVDLCNCNFSRPHRIYQGKKPFNVTKPRSFSLGCGVRTTTTFGVKKTKTRGKVQVRPPTLSPPSLLDGSPPRALGATNETFPTFSHTHDPSDLPRRCVAGYKKAWVLFRKL